MIGLECLFLCFDIGGKIGGNWGRGWGGVGGGGLGDNFSAGYVLVGHNHLALSIVGLEISDDVEEPPSRLSTVYDVLYTLSSAASLFVLWGVF